MDIKILKQNEEYSREEIHGIFSPHTKFTKGAGTWGIQGIVKIPSRENDFIFIVTYGQSQGNHQFDEGITSEGVLSWQSQAKERLQDARINQFINHDELTNNIYLFLRENVLEDYQYKGRLKYISHDNEREKPVFFQWQLLDWQSKEEEYEITIESVEKKAGKLTLTQNFPSKKNRVGTKLEAFRQKKSPDYAQRDLRNKKIGDIGEKLVLYYEKKRLIQAGYQNLAEKIVHTSFVEGDGAGYDVKSFNEDGSERFIEVKTTRGGLNTDFFMSPNELQFSVQNENNFFLYRVYDLSKKNNASFYIIKGDVNKEYNKTPTGYRLSKK